MITEFGKCLRKTRIDNQELMVDMAEKLGVSPAYLSAVENGKRNAPEKWVESIIEKYSLSPASADALKAAFDDSQENVKIPLKGATDLQKSTVVSFAKALNGLTDSDLKKIMSVVKSSGGGVDNR